MKVFIVVSLHGYQEDQIIEKIYAREEDAMQYIATQDQKREALGYKWEILDKEVIL